MAPAGTGERAARSPSTTTAEPAVRFASVTKTHYEVLGVGSTASADQIRKAYHDEARRLHPDSTARRFDADASDRAMQDVNEAWRVLREPSSRASYDEALRLRSAPPPPPAEVDDELDRPYQHAVAEPGDLTVSLVRAAPWVAVLVVLAAIVVFTAFARRGDDEGDLVGRCINTHAGRPEEAPCDEPNDGRVVLIVDREAGCPTGSTGRVVASGKWFCLRSDDEE